VIDAFGVAPPLDFEEATTYVFACPPIGTPKNIINKKMVPTHKQQAMQPNRLLLFFCFFSMLCNSFLALSYSL
jgi:hypothetical protein